MKRLLLGLSLAAAATVGGCALPMAEHQPTLANIQLIRQGDIAPMRVGDFARGPGVSAEADKSMQIRGGTMSSPDGGSFSRYLGETVAAELKGAGRLDPNSTLVVSGLLMESHANSAMPTAKGALGARFTLTREGRVVFDKFLRVEDEWVSPFVGAVAIPAAFDHYTALYPKLVGELLADPEFRAAAHR